MNTKSINLQMNPVNFKKHHNYMFFPNCISRNIFSRKAKTYFFFFNFLLVAFCFWGKTMQVNMKKNMLFKFLKFQYNSLSIFLNNQQSFYMCQVSANVMHKFWNFLNLFIIYLQAKSSFAFQSTFLRNLFAGKFHGTFLMRKEFHYDQWKWKRG